MSVFNVNYSQTGISLHSVAVRSAATHPSHVCRSYCSDHVMHWHMMGGPRVVSAICTLLRHLGLYTVHRKSRIVNVVEALHKAVDDHCEYRLSQIQKAKERHAYDTKCKACLLPRVAVRTCMYMCASGCVCVFTHAMCIVHSIFRMIDLPECLLPCGVYITAYYNMHRRQMLRSGPVRRRRRRIGDQSAAPVENSLTMWLRRSMQ